MTFIPFLRQRRSNTTYTTPPYWERNDWKRRHGYQFPLDSYLLLQWAASLALDLFFYYFLIHFITTLPDTPHLDATLELVKQWPLADPPQDHVTSSWLWASHAREVMGLICIGIKVLSVITSFIDTEEPAVKNSQAPRSKSYVKKYGISVIDPYTSICGICRVKVPKTTRHCKLCNKCISGMDHHCKWLNCCIGWSNYRLFIVLVTCAFVSLVWYSSLALYVVFLCFFRKNIFMLRVIQWLNMPLNDDTMVSLTRTYYTSMTFTCFVALFAVCALVAMVRLLAFHIRLAFLNMTTIEFISHSMNRPTVYDDDTTDDEYDMDDDDSDTMDEDETHDYPWKRPRKVNAPKQEGHVMGMLNAWTYSTLRVGYRLVNGRKRTSWWRRIIPNQRKKRSWAARKKRESYTHRRNTVDLEEILATRTIRPITTLDDDGPDYDDDMGLDMNILDEGYATNGKQQQQLGDNRLSSKAARLLDMTDSEARLYQASQKTDTILID
ncbi:DHHC palmitoyltransferase-domain-containing protein [Chlamydoabsidia padenii]|nr:DHHC palmitoyltransferase-domain-containing protein [Chlamydoabsidia padenii]